jgi:PPM family protein phosphatase
VRARGPETSSSERSQDRHRAPVTHRRAPSHSPGFAALASAGNRPPEHGRGEDRVLVAKDTIAIADGVSTRPAGQVAAALALQEIDRWQRSGETTLASLDEAFASANSEIVRTSGEHRGCFGMEASLTVVRVVGRKLLVGHIGDTRAYLLRDGRALRLTRDHTWAGLLGTQGPPEEPAGALLLALGRVRVVPSLVAIALHAGDIVLVCSDGLVGVVDHEALERIMRVPVPLSERATLLLECATRGVTDEDVTVVIGRVGGNGAPATAHAADASS